MTTRKTPRAATPRAKRPRGNGTPPKDKGRRVTTAEVDARIATVLELVVNGIARRAQLFRALGKNYGDGKINWVPSNVAEAVSAADRPGSFVVSPRMVDVYISRATVQLQTSADEQRAVAKGKARARYERALAGAFAAKQWDVVRKVNRDLVRLDGLEPGTGVRVTHDGTVNATVSGEVDHIHRVTTLEERAATITDILGTALARRAQKVQTVAAVGSPESN